MKKVGKQKVLSGNLTAEECASLQKEILSLNSKPKPSSRLGIALRLFTTKPGE